MSDKEKILKLRPQLKGYGIVISNEGTLICPGEGLDRGGDICYRTCQGTKGITNLLCIDFPYNHFIKISPITVN